MPRVKPAGWSHREKLTSTQITEIDRQAAAAFDHLAAGVQRIRRVADFAALKSIPAASLTSGDVCFVDQFGLYVYEPELAEAERVPAVIASNDAAGPGLWRWDSARSGNARIPARSVGSGIGIVFCNHYRRTTPLVFNGTSPPIYLDGGIQAPLNGFHCRPGDMVTSTLSFYASRHNSQLDAENGTNTLPWDDPGDHFTITAKGVTLVGSDSFAIIGGIQVKSGYNTIHYSYTDVGKELYHLSWRIDFELPAVIALNKIHVQTTVIRP